jgi:bisphosphoglycerate-dependent phosphoglycerate mutase
MDQSSENKANSRFENFGRRVDERFQQALPRMEEELNKVIAYINDQVVPQVRQGSSSALRTAADGLRKLAEQLDNHRGEQ